MVSLEIDRPALRIPPQSVYEDYGGGSREAHQDIRRGELSEAAGFRGPAGDVKAHIPLDKGIKVIAKSASTEPRYYRVRLVVISEAPSSARKTFTV